MPQDFNDQTQLDEEQDYSSDQQQLPFLSVNFVQQVDELVSLAHYGPSIVLVLGEDGIGKTCTLEQLENETNEIGQIRIDGNPMLSIDQLHASFLQQLNNYEQAVEYNSVRDSLLRASEISEQLILVDDAQQLSTSVLESLISLVSPIEQSPAVPVRLFLFGNEDLKQQLKMDTFPQTAVYCMQLKGFEKDEISAFLGHQLNLSDDDADESFDNKSISHMWKESQGNPGMIIRSLVNDDIELEDVEEISRNPLSAIIFRSLLALLGVSLLLLALFGEKWFGESWLQGGSEKPSNEAIAVELNIIDGDNKDSQQGNPNTATMDPIAENITIQSSAESVIDQNPTKEAPTEFEDVTLSNEIIENNNQAELETQLTEKISENEQNIVQDKNETPLSPAESDEQTAANSATVSSIETIVEPHHLTQTNSSESTSKFTIHENYLLDQSENHYSIQLMGLSNLEEMEKFAKNLTSNQPLYIYRSLLNGNAWFILVSGNYADAETARTARDKLNRDLKKLSPWIKSYAKIQKEIRQASKSR